MKNAGFTSALLRVCNALLLIVLVVIVLFLELPQGVGWIHKPTVLTIALPGIVLIHLATRPKRHELFIGAVLAMGLFVCSVSACRNSLELLLAGGGSLEALPACSHWGSIELPGLRSLKSLTHFQQPPCSVSFLPLRPSSSWPTLPWHLKRLIPI